MKCPYCQAEMKREGGRAARPAARAGRREPRRRR